MYFYHQGSRSIHQKFDGARLAKRLEDIRVHAEFWPDEAN